MKITSVNPMPGYRLELHFDNGDEGLVDLSSFVGRGVFAEWQNPGVFEKVKVTAQGALEWPGEIDLCPDALYLQMTGKRAEDIFPSLQSPLTNA